MIKLHNLLAGTIAVAVSVTTPSNAQKAPEKAATKKTAAKAPVKSGPAKSGPVQVKLASPADLVAAIKSCSTAVSQDGLVPANLTTAGWKVAPTKTQSGKAVKMPMRTYSHSGSQALIMLPPTNAKKGGCIVLAKLANLQDVALAGNTLSAEIGVKPIKLADGSPMWRSGQRAIQIAADGSPKQPSVRAVVIYSQGGAT